MRFTNRLVALLLVPFFLVSSPALAQQDRIVNAAAMHEALAGKAAAERGQRDLVLRVLDREDVREMAARFGLDVADARAAVAAMDVADLGTLAQHAGALEASDLAGGANTIVISTTTLLLLIIIIILLAK
jgi:hypothetical protein